MSTPGDNVIHADFGSRETAEGGIPLFDMRVSCRLVYADALVSVSRLTYTVNGTSFVQHVMTEAGAGA